MKQEVYINFRGPVNVSPADDRVFVSGLMTKEEIQEAIESLKVSLEILEGK